MASKLSGAVCPTAVYCQLLAALALLPALVRATALPIALIPASSVMGLLTGAQKDYPKMTEILARMADIFAPKHEDYVTQLTCRIRFINMTPCTQEHRLQSALIEWEELREELKTRGNEQGSIEVLASLKILLSGLSKVQSLLNSAKLILGVEKIGLDKLLGLTKGCGKDLGSTRA